MAQVSKYPIPKDVADRIFSIFLKAFIEIKNDTDADEFISDLLTPTEKIMLAKRLAIAFLLEKNYDYRTIQKLIRVSAPTITGVNRARRYGSDGYKKLIVKIISEEKLMAFFDNAITNLVAVPASIERKSSAWRYLKAELDKKRKTNLFSSLL